MYQGTCIERAVQRRSGLNQRKQLGEERLEVRGCGVGQSGMTRVWLWVYRS